MLIMHIFTTHQDIITPPTNSHDQCHPHLAFQSQDILLITFPEECILAFELLTFTCIPKNEHLKCHPNLGFQSQDI